MSHAQARQRALEAVGAFEGDDVVCIGEGKKVQDYNGAAYLPWPQPHARRNGVSKGADVDLYVHGSTGVLVVVPQNG